MLKFLLKPSLVAFLYCLFTVNSLQAVEVSKLDEADVPVSSRAVPERNQALKKALDRICRYAVDAVEDGFEVLVLQDRAVDSDHAPIPSLLSTAAIHHHLIRKGHRGKVGIIVRLVGVLKVFINAITASISSLFKFSFFNNGDVFGIKESLPTPLYLF